MEAVYEWIRQIAVFAVISYLVLYLMGNQEKKYTLRFYLSLLMILLILKPAVSAFNLEQVLTEKLTELEAGAEMTAVNSQIRQIAAASDQEFLDYTSERALSWVRELAEGKALELKEGKVNFDDEKLEQSGEVVISGLEIVVSAAGKQASEVRSLIQELKSEIAAAFNLDKNAVTIRLEK